MDVLAKNLFDDFEEEACGLQFQSLSPPAVSRLGACRSVFGEKSENNSSRIADLNSSLKSSDSFLDASMEEFLSPSNSPMKVQSSPEMQGPIFNCSPPCLNKGILNLRLFDTPHTPKTLFTKSKKLSFEENESPGRASPYRARTSLRQKSLRRELINNLERKRPQTEPRPDHKVVYANFNPFTPNSEVHMKAKRPRIQNLRYG